MPENNTQSTTASQNPDNNNTTQKAVFGAGCFWCVEALFDLLEGVESVTSGYTGGSTPDPSYKDICTGQTGHAEVIEVIYDPSVISYPELLEAFFMAHDPTTLNRQGNDIGTQYRSAIFYTTPQQKEQAENMIHTLNEQKVFPQPIVTKVEPLTTFYPAEDYHQEYFELNGEQPYCSMVIKPKYDKFKKVMADKIKQRSDS